MGKVLKDRPAEFLNFLKTHISSYYKDPFENAEFMVRRFFQKVLPEYKIVNVINFFGTMLVVIGEEDSSDIYTATFKIPPRLHLKSSLTTLLKSIKKVDTL